MNSKNIFKRLFVWTVICSMSAAPSFFLAYREFDLGGMVAGIVCFILVYSIVSGSSLAASLSRDPFARRALKIGYVGRVVLSLSMISPFPVLFLDAIPGMLAVELTKMLPFNQLEFAGTFITTIIQGVFLNNILAFVMWIIYGLQYWILPAPQFAGICRKCGYDLRATPERCPECGTQVARIHPVAIHSNT